MRGYAWPWTGAWPTADARVTRERDTPGREPTFAGDRSLRSGGGGPRFWRLRERRYLVEDRSSAVQCSVVPLVERHDGSRFRWGPGG